MNIGISTSGLMQAMGGTIAKELPNGIAADQLPSLSPLMQESMQKALSENGFPGGLFERMENLTASDNSDVWDAQVAYMAEHPDESHPDFERTNETISQMAENPDAEAAYLDTLVTDMTNNPESVGGLGGMMGGILGGGSKGDLGGIKDLMGGGVLQNMNQSMQQIMDKMSERMEAVGELLPEDIEKSFEETNSEQGNLELQQSTQQNQEMLNLMDSFLDQYHDTQMNVVENLHSNEGNIIEGEAIAMVQEENIVDADPEPEVFDAYRDEDSDSYNDDPSPDQLA